MTSLLCQHLHLGGGAAQGVKAEDVGNVPSEQKSPEEKGGVKEAGKIRGELGQGRGAEDPEVEPTVNEVEVERGEQKGLQNLQGHLHTGPDNLWSRPIPHLEKGGKGTCHGLTTHGGPKVPTKARSKGRSRSGLITAGADRKRHGPQGGQRKPT